MPTRTIILNSSNYNSNNTFLYKFPSSIDMKPTDKIGIQSISLFNSFFNITSALMNNLMTLVWPCYTPTGTTTVLNGYIENACSFVGSISNPQPCELYGTTITNSGTLQGFIGGTKILVASGYISGTVLKVSSGTPALSVGMYVNGSSTQIVSGANPTWNLSNSALGTIGSAVAPVTSIFANGVGNILYVTTAPSASVSTTTASPTLFITSTAFVSYSLPGTVTLTNTVGTYATNASNIYVPLGSITYGLGSSTFVGTSDAPLYPGMSFTYNGTLCNILNFSITGSLYTLSLSNVVGIFNNTLVSDVKVLTDLNGKPILSVNSISSGNGILFNYNLFGVGISSNILIGSQISSSVLSSNAEGLYKISYNPDLSMVAMYAKDSVLSNSVLNVTSITSGSIVQGMILKDANNLISNYNVVIGTQLTGNPGSIGTYNVSSSSIIPSIYPEEIIGSASYSNSITIPITIPDGYYNATSLNYFLQNVMIENNLYLTDSTGQNNTYFIEILQNSVSYSLQVNIFPLPTSLSATQFYPQDAVWNLPNITQSPQLLINSNLLPWFGFSPTYTSSNPTASLNNGFLSLPSSPTILAGILKSYTSNICPQINSISSIVIRCNLINNDLSSPSDNFITAPLKNTFGNIISIDYSTALLNVRGGMENELRHSFYTPDEYPINILDNDITVQLIIEQNNYY